MAVAVEHDVIELKVAVDDSSFVEEDKCTDNLSGIEARARLVELSRLLDLEHQIAASDKLHHEEQAVVGLLGCETRNKSTI